MLVICCYTGSRLFFTIYKKAGNSRFKDLKADIYIPSHYDWGMEGGEEIKKKKKFQNLRQLILQLLELFSYLFIFILQVIFLIHCNLYEERDKKINAHMWTSYHIISNFVRSFKKTEPILNCDIILPLYGLPTLICKLITKKVVKWCVRKGKSVTITGS